MTDKPTQATLLEELRRAKGWLESAEATAAELGDARARGFVAVAVSLVGTLRADIITDPRKAKP